MSKIPSHKTFLVDADMLGNFWSKPNANCVARHWNRDCKTLQSCLQDLLNQNVGLQDIGV